MQNVDKTKWRETKKSQDKRGKAGKRELQYRKEAEQVNNVVIYKFIHKFIYK